MKIIQNKKGKWLNREADTAEEMDSYIKGILQKFTHRTFEVVKEITRNEYERKRFISSLENQFPTAIEDLKNLINVKYRGI